MPPPPWCSTGTAAPRGAFRVRSAPGRRPGEGQLCPSRRRRARVDGPSGGPGGPPPVQLAERLHRVCLRRRRRAAVHCHEVVPGRRPASSPRRVVPAPVGAGGEGGRTAGELLAWARGRREDRQRAARDEAARRAEARRLAARRAREMHLSELASRQERAWREVLELVERRTAADYDTAVALLADLAEVCSREGTSETFAARIAQLPGSSAARSPSYRDSTAPAWSDPTLRLVNSALGVPPSGSSLTSQWWRGPKSQRRRPPGALPFMDRGGSLPGRVR
ncbi:hypothetical protein FHU33_2350 [Blastococcus colisei]|uniref:Uncharacterized protein n=1 Tax=Blastococcus colisei TaxID=1564162 RepID=A0A543PFU0_9ACTN|nr:hypothetical protein FHU33_2350 [Blastococcus colisei]